MPPESTAAARERLIATLDEMAERLRAAPDWVEPTAEESKQNFQEVKAWLRGRGYLVDD